MTDQTYNCKGCVNDSLSDDCKIIEYYKQSQEPFDCPCAECLVKVTCERSCPPFFKFKNEVLDWLHAEWASHIEIWGYEYE